MLAVLIQAVFFCKAGELEPRSGDEPVIRLSVDVCPRPVENWLEAQIELARRGFSSGPIDGVPGGQSAAALRAWQEREELPVSGRLDQETRDKLILELPPVTLMSVSEGDLASLQSLSATWLGKSQQSSLAHETALELVAERTHAHPNLIKKLNPKVDWAAVTPEMKLTVPSVGPVAINARAAQIHIRLGEHVLQVRDADGITIAHFPVSIAQRAEKRPDGELHVTVVIHNPDYTFDPAVFPESPEGRELGRKLILPPGPNNPVGMAWIGLDLPGYGIHGTPSPEKVGRTESHGCFRLANWDAVLLAYLAWVGMPVFVDP